MCGRFSQYTDLPGLARRFGVPEVGVRAEPRPPRYNIAPSASVLAVRLEASGGRELVSLKWGLVPHWSVEPKTSYSTSNARAETVDTKPVFRAAFKARRCLIPADGWYEWQLVPDAKTKQPWYYRVRDGVPLAFAGLWDRWEQQGQVLESCTVIVCPANAVARPVHDRMPAILGEAEWGRWLDPATSAGEAKAMLAPCPDEWLAAYPVSRAVSFARNEGAGLIEAVALPASG